MQLIKPIVVTQTENTLSDRSLLEGNVKDGTLFGTAAKLRETISEGNFRIKLIT